MGALEQIRGLNPVVGAIAFIGLYILATVAFLPGSVLTLGAGVIYGPIQGSICVFVGATLGATLAFLVGRYGAREWIARKIAGNVKFAAIDRAVGQEGFKIVVLTRLSPIFPFNLLNYAYGLTSVSLRDYFLASIGMVPGTVMYVYIGSLARDLTMTLMEPEEATWVNWVIRILIGVTTIGIGVYAAKIARKALAADVLSETGPEEVSDGR